MRGYRPSCSECGWTGKPCRSQAQAEYAYRRHSCALQRKRDAARIARVRRRSRIDRTPKPCLHKVAQHEHGTHACYVLDRCKCWPCTKSNREYESHRARMLAYGRSNLVDAQPVREHVAALTAAGIGLKYVAKRSGVAHGALWKLVYGKAGRPPSRRVRKHTADRLLALRPGLDLMADGAKVPGVGTRRRLQALACLGWSMRRIEAEADVDRQAIDNALRGGDVLARTHRAVAEVYERLWDTPPQPRDRFEQGGITRTAKRAQALGWAPPLAWDDDAIDNPDATPLHRLQDDERGVDEAAVERRIAGERVKLTRAERWTVVRRLHEQGMTDPQIAHRTGIHPRQVLRDRRDLGLTANATPSGDHSGRVA